jgi:F-type H+-transporting ATPase subunit alpha
MSITDGQIIFDLGVFRQGIRPAVNAGLSVSRVGGQAQTKRQKRLSGTLFKKLAQYHQAEEFSHFGSSLSKSASIDLQLGKQIYDVLKQPPEQLWSLTQQQLMLETVLLGEGSGDIDIAGLKETVGKITEETTDDAKLDATEKDLLAKFAVKPKAPATVEPKAGTQPAPAAATPAPQSAPTKPTEEKK